MDSTDSRVSVGPQKPYMVAADKSLVDLAAFFKTLQAYMDAHGGRLPMDATVNVGDVTVSDAKTASPDGGTTKVYQKSDEDGTVHTRNVGALIHVDYDYIGVTWDAGTCTEVFVYKNGGEEGTTVATVTTVYADASKSQLASVART